MADTKISALTASTTPLAGTEVLPIVQSGITKQVSVANLTAGRAISATQLTLSTGNLIVASGQGIDFSATPGTGTSELLADYEEGTWTPVITSTIGSITTSSATGTYTKVGRLVYVSMSITITNNGTGAGVLSASLPFTSGVGSTSLGRETNATGTAVQVVTYPSASTVDLFTLANGYPAASGYGFSIGFTYSV